MPRRLSPLLHSLGLVAALAAAPAAAAPSHGYSPFGDLKYAGDFGHFDYVNPAAPKGGTLRLSAIGTFDSLNPYIIPGVAVGEGLEFSPMSLVYETLMVSSGDEPSSFYGLVARTIDVADDFSSATVAIDPAARFSDGTPVTADDVVFSFQVLKAKGDSNWRQSLAGIGQVAVPAPGQVRFDFVPPYRRSGPMVVANLPVFSAAWWQGRPFDRPSLAQPLGTGPYLVDKIDAGHTVTFKRNPDYWGRDLPVNRGRFNFDDIRYDYFRDRDVDFEAFKAGAYDWREEFTSRFWATGYTGPAVARGQIRRDTVPDNRPSGVQAFFPNLRRAKFQNIAVRRALDLAFDFEWTNRTMFFGAYRRMASIFENSPLAAHDWPDAAEISILERLRGQVPDTIFTGPYAPPRSDASGEIRDRLKAARDLLDQAGWTLKGGTLVNQAGDPFTIEFLIDEPTFTRIIEPFIRNLARLGIAATIRQVDPTAYQARREAFDYDIITQRFGLSPTPGDELRNLWGSAAADLPGALNLAGIKDPVVDRLIEAVLDAESRPDFVTACHALDRVVMGNEYLIPQWYKGEHTIAWWDRFGRPRTAPLYTIGHVDTWWFDPRRSAATDAGTPLPAAADGPGDGNVTPPSVGAAP